jgi:hypothetical protein
LLWRRTAWRGAFVRLCIQLGFHHNKFHCHAAGSAPDGHYVMSGFTRFKPCLATFELEPLTCVAIRFAMQ